MPGPMTIWTSEIGAAPGGCRCQSVGAHPRMLTPANVPSPTPFVQPPSFLYPEQMRMRQALESRIVQMPPYPAFTRTAVYPGTNIPYSEVPVQQNRVQTERGFDVRWVDNYGTLASNTLGDSLYAYLR